jgi:molybdopterin-guanine dinucleotide biosynthesis protein A
MTDAPKTLGVLLAGGLSSRMGGGDKPLLKVGGVSILDRAMAALRPQCEALILSANGDPARFAATGLPVVADDMPGFAGPLAGILAALDWTAANRPDVDWVVSVAADSPFLPADFVARLHEAREEADVQLAQAQGGNQPYPVNGLWKVALRGDLREALIEDGVRKVSAWTARHGVVSVIWPADPVDPFFNANTPEELTEAEKLIAGLD